WGFVVFWVVGPPGQFFGGGGGVGGVFFGGVFGGGGGGGGPLRDGLLFSFLVWGSLVTWALRGQGRGEREATIPQWL
ncbi:MAG: hypothetical protein RMI39_00520, partial [Thermoanaerobaculum sp.]|nr:hypothetical protein [Thermoanaerobaculum sp.]